MAYRGYYYTLYSLGFGAHRILTTLISNKNEVELKEFTTDTLHLIINIYYRRISNKIVFITLTDTVIKMKCTETDYRTIDFIKLF